MGMFRIVNFDTLLPVTLMNEMKSVAASLLELPSEIKQRNVDVTTDRINPIHEGWDSTILLLMHFVPSYATPQQRFSIGFPLAMKFHVNFEPKSLLVILRSSRVLEFFRSLGVS
ncbi:hypothetical protein BUALT_Bualt16G0027700 [Buddleja alternifolia]|uniref:Uncharacterized protein n=1 Tax=Buddleja alternifolia TaxID=168488 RepID=A0AAV6WA34_9LAMI|nr:hypothetical protein BUALT_Bualt16G0027700 [Buddleja alternifolia]